MSSTNTAEGVARILAHAYELRSQAVTARINLERQRADMARDLALEAEQRGLGDDWIQQQLDMTLPLSTLPPLATDASRLFNMTLNESVLPWIEFDEQFPALSVYRRMTLEQLAQEILDRPGINLAEYGHPHQISGLRTALWNIRHTAQGEPVRTRPYYQINPPFVDSVGEVHLSRYLLEVMLLLNDRFNDLRINAIAGLDHGGEQRDEHVRGIAFDMTNIPNADPRLDVMYFLQQNGFVTQVNIRRVVNESLLNTTLFTDYTYVTFPRNVNTNTHVSIYGHIAGFHEIVQQWSNNSQ